MASPNKIILGEDEVSSLHDKIIHALPGSHNLLNVSLALSVVCAVLGVARDLAEIKHFVDLNSASFNLALASFQTLPHRIQLVHSIQDTIDLKNAGKSQNLELIINFYDDGYATEPDANIAAIKTLTSKPNEFLWIQMTGKDKGGELEELAELIQTKIESKQIYKVDLSGKVGQRIGTLLLLPNDRINLSQLTFRELVTTRFQSIFELKQQFESWVNELNLEMDSDQIILNILFSPGGSSFDEFDNSGQRADWWVERVRSMKE
jgi:UDP-N-acetylmuramoylalanine-D-glutamate ligase